MGDKVLVEIKKYEEANTLIFTQVCKNKFMDSVEGSFIWFQSVLDTSYS